MATCSVPECNGKKCFKFPKDVKVSNEWLLAIGRPNFTPKRWDGLCDKHFRPSDFVVEGAETGLPLTVRLLKWGTVPSVLLNTQTPCRPFKKIRHDEVKRDVTPEPELLPREESDLGVQSLPSEGEGCGTSNPDVFLWSKDETAEECVVESLAGSDSKDISGYADKCCGTDKVKVCDVKVQTVARVSPYIIEDFRDKPELLQHLTGLENYDRFMLVFYSLGPNVYSLHYLKNVVKNVSVADQLFLTLWKLRKCTPDVELGMHFGIHQSSVSNIFCSMIKFMANQWGKLDIWPSRDLVTYYMPENFKQMYPSMRVIVDGTEVPIEKPQNPRAQQSSYSTYKNTNIVKVLVGGSPSGLISYCSEAYGGSTTDRQIVERSPLLEMYDWCDSVMADRGFNVQDLFAPKDVTVNIPAFLKGKDHLPGVTIMKDRKLASKRVHIERLIGLAKTYKMLKNRLSHFHTPMASEIFYVCVMLCNFREKIVSNTA